MTSTRSRKRTRTPYERRSISLRALVKLKLNPGEAPSRKVIELIDQMETYTHSSQEAKMKRVLNEIVSASQVAVERRMGQGAFRSSARRSSSETASAAVVR